MHSAAPILPRRPPRRTPEVPGCGPELPGGLAGPREAIFSVTPPSYALNTSQAVHATAELGGSDTGKAGVTVTAGG